MKYLAKKKSKWYLLSRLITDLWGEAPYIQRCFLHSPKVKALKVEGRLLCKGSLL